MKAWVISKQSLEGQSGNKPSKNLRLIDLDIPRINNPDEVIVEMRASSINFNTVWSCLRHPVDPFTLLSGHIKRNPRDSHHAMDYFIPGSDGSGVVVDVGSDVTDFKIGDEVVVHCAVISNEDLALPDPMLSTSQSIWGYETNYGAFAEYTLVRSSQLIKKPSGIDFLTAGSCLLTLGTAYRMLVSNNGCRIRTGETCLIWGAAGGLGVFAIQLCNFVGAIPVCVVSDLIKAEVCRSLGAKHVIVCAAEDQSAFVDSFGRPQYSHWRKFEKKLIETLGQRRVDCVFEHVGRNALALSIYLLNRGGRLVTCAATSGFEAFVDIRFLWMEMKKLIGSHFCNLREACAAFDLLVKGQIIHPYGEKLYFESIPEGIERLFERRSNGKIVVEFHS